MPKDTVERPMRENMFMDVWQDTALLQRTFGKDFRSLMKDQLICELLLLSVKNALYFQELFFHLFSLSDDF